jgi:hypothetical protein
MSSYCVRCGNKLDNPDNGSTLCPNCIKETHTTPANVQSMSPPPSMQAPTNFPLDRSFAAMKLKSIWKSAIEALAILFGFALIGFSGIEIGATVASVLGYSSNIFFVLPIAAVCEIGFLLAILHEYGSLRIEF